MAIFGWEGLKRLGKRQQATNAEVGTGPGAKCDSCGELLLKATLEEKMGVCPMCDHHHRLGARERIAITLDENSFEEIHADLSSKDVLSFRAKKSYGETLESAMENTQLLDAMVTGRGLLCARPVAFGVTDGSFLAGSMGSVLGEKFVRLADVAIAERRPMIVVSSSGGGARMYEGVFSLMQMAKTSAAIARLQEAGVPYIVVLSHFTMAGIWASWASLGDVILSEPRAMIGFTGQRVIKATIKQELPDGLQTAEFVLEHGQIDMIVHRHDIRNRLAQVLNLMLGEVPAVDAAS